MAAQVDTADKTAIRGVFASTLGTRLACLDFALSSTPALFDASKQNEPEMNGNERK